MKSLQSLEILKEHIFHRVLSKPSVSTYDIHKNRLKSNETSNKSQFLWFQQSNLDSKPKTAFSSVCFLLFFSDNGELAFTFEFFNGNDPVDPGTAIALGTDLVGKLTVFFISVTADKETRITRRHRSIWSVQGKFQNFSIAVESSFFINNTHIPTDASFSSLSSIYRVDLLYFLGHHTRINLP